MEENLKKDEIVFNVKSKAPSETPTTKKSGGGYFYQMPEAKVKTVSPEVFEEMKKVYDVVCVNDYNDEYHMSEEERKQKSKYYEVFSQLSRCKRKFRKLNEFVKVYRIALKCLKEVANNNGIYDPEDFIVKVLRGDIEVYGLQFPKYIGKDKKDINWKYISDYITDETMNPEDLSKNQDSELDDLTKKELSERIFSPDELSLITELAKRDEDEDIETKFFDEHDESQENTVFMGKKNEIKKFIKMSPEILKGLNEALREHKKSMQQDNRLNSFVFEMTEDDYAYIESMDKEYGYHSDSDIPVFKGDISKRKDYKKYLMALEIYDNERIKYNYNGKMRTLEEIKEIQLKEALERDGWNMRALYREKDREKKLKKAYKEDKKREEALRKKLVQIQDKQKNRKSSGIEFDSKKKKKKDKKKKKAEDE